MLSRAIGRRGLPVASRAGAWIETRDGAEPQGKKRSPPARGRGLKPVIVTLAIGLRTRRLPRGGVD